jgi:hypothetical protein
VGGDSHGRLPAQLGPRPSARVDLDACSAVGEGGDLFRRQGASGQDDAFIR